MTPPRKEKILFLCTGNSCRSQMAEGLLRAMAGGRCEVFSAGTRPQGVHPDAVRVMREIGIDISQQRSQHVDEFLDAGIDRVIAVCSNARESCPVFPGNVARLHWSFDDPAAAAGGAEARMAVFRRVRDEIGAALRNWLER